MSKSEKTDRFQIDTLEERVAPAAASAGLGIAADAAAGTTGADHLPDADSTGCAPEDPSGGRP